MIALVVALFLFLKAIAISFPLLLAIIFKGKMKQNLVYFFCCHYCPFSFYSMPLSISGREKEGKGDIWRQKMYRVLFHPRARKIDNNCCPNSWESNSYIAIQKRSRKPMYKTNAIAILKKYTV